MRLNPNTLLASAATAVLVAGCSIGEGQPTPPSEASTQVQNPDTKPPLDKVVVDFVETPWSTATPPEQQELSLKNAKIGLQNLYNSSLGKGVDVTNVPVVNGGSFRLDNIGDRSQVCGDTIGSNSNLQKVQTAIIDAVHKQSKPENNGPNVMTYIVLNGIAAENCGYAGGGTTELGGRDALIWGSNRPDAQAPLGPYLAAHEFAHTGWYNVTTSTATFCGPMGSSGKHREPESSQNIPLSKATCDVALLRDFGVNSGSDESDKDMFSGPELASIGAITADQIVTVNDNESVTIDIDALQNPTAPGQKKLIKVPGSALFELSDITYLGGDVYFEVSGGSPAEVGAGKPLSVRAYTASSGVITGDVDGYTKAPSNISTAPFTNSKNTNEVGEGMSFDGPSGSVSVKIDALTATSADQGHARLVVSTK